MQLFSLKFLMLAVAFMPLFSASIKGFAHAQEEEEPTAEDELMEDDVSVDDETDAEDSIQPTPGGAEEEEEEDVDDDEGLKPSPDADSTLLFVKPTTPDLPAGSMAHLLAGFANNGEKDFILNSIDAGFVHPQDFRYHMLNFTRAYYYQRVESGRHASLEYVFPVREDLIDRPFGLVITLNYTTDDGEEFMNVLYNDTISIIEQQEGLDGETFFLYVTLAALALLALFGIHHVLNNLRRKHLSKPRPVEMGTQAKGVDMDWIPRETMKVIDGSPRKSPKTSPRLRRSARNTNKDE